jgi:hypothetical protein
MMVYLVCGKQYDGFNDEFITENIAVYADEQQAQALAKEAQTFDENEGYLSNFYWVEPWEVQ